MNQYAFPLDPSWSTEEIVKVVNFLDTVDNVYLKGVPLSKVYDDYQAYQAVVDSIGAQKRLDREFQRASGYSIYQVVKAMEAIIGRGSGARQALSQHQKACLKLQVK